MRLYNRQATLEIYTNDASSTQLVDLSGLDFSFTVAAKLPENKKKKNRSSVVTATASIHKLSPSTREKITSSKSGIALGFGYGDDMFELFKGLTVNTTHEYLAPDWTTMIWASHEWEAYKESYFSRSYAKGVSVKSVVDDVLRTFGLPFVNHYDRSDSLMSGTIYDGESHSVMDELALDYDLSWSIADSTVTVTDSLNPPLVDRARVSILGPSVISGPIVEDSLVDEKKKNSKTARRIRVTSLLLPWIYPGVYIRFKDLLFHRAFSNIADRSLRDVDESAIHVVESVVHRASSMAKDPCISEIVTKETKI